MFEFHHHPDGLIYLRTEAATYVEDLPGFAADAAACGLPPYDTDLGGFRERRYEPGAFHRLYTADSQFPAPADWPAGDAYLAAVDALVLAQAARLAPEP